MVVIKVDLRHKDLNKRFAELRIRRISVAEPFEPERELVARQLRLLNLFILDRDFQIYAPRFEIVEPLLRAGRNNALLDGRDQVRDRALNFDELRLESAENAVVLFAFLQIHRRVDDHADDVVGQTPLAQEPDERFLDPFLSDGLLFASAPVFAFGARVVVEFFAAAARSAFADHRTAAMTAEELAGQNIVDFRSARARCAGDFFHAFLHFVE